MANAICLYYCGCNNYFFHAIYSMEGDFEVGIFTVLSFRYFAVYNRFICVDRCSLYPHHCTAHEAELRWSTGSSTEWRNTQEARGCSQDIWGGVTVFPDKLRHGLHDRKQLVAANHVLHVFSQPHLQPSHLSSL